MRRSNLPTIVLAIVMALATSASGQVDARWDGSAFDTLWATIENWTPEAIPDATVDTVRFTDAGVMGVVDMGGDALDVKDMFISGAANGYEISNGALTVDNGIHHSAGGTNTISGALSMTGGAITVSNGALNLTNISNSISGATITVGSGAELAFDSDIAVYDLFVSGAIDAAGSRITSANNYHNLANGAVINANLAGALIELKIGENGDWDHVVVAAGAHEYTGLTIIRRGALDIGDLSVNSLPAASHIKFDQQDAEYGAVLMAHGTGDNKFVRNIGSATTADTLRWYNDGGGFAARGGPLEVLLRGGSEIDWSSSSRGFARRTVAFGHAVADNTVTLLNDIDLDGDRSIVVYDNHDTDADVAEMRGVIEENIPGRLLIKRAANDETWASRQSGTLWLSNAANSYTYTRIQGGAIRLTRDEDGLGAYKVQFYANGHDQPAVIESKGAFERTIARCRPKCTNSCGHDCSACSCSSQWIRTSIHHWPNAFSCDAFWKSATMYGANIGRDSTRKSNHRIHNRKNYIAHHGLHFVGWARQTKNDRLTNSCAQSWCSSI